MTAAGLFFDLWPWLAQAGAVHQEPNHVRKQTWNWQTLHSAGPRPEWRALKLCGIFHKSPAVWLAAGPEMCFLLREKAGAAKRCAALPVPRFGAP